LNAIDLSNQVAVVTGGAGGIGLAIARRLIASGAKVSLWDLRQDALDSAKTELGDAASSVAVDITDFAGLQRAVAGVEASVGPISIMVNSAGITGNNDTLEDYDPALWRQVVEVNLNGTFYVNKAVIPGMKARNYGRIVNVASVAGKEGNPNASAYSSAKAGVIGLTKSLGKELATTGIRVNCVTPAAVETDIFKQMKPEHVQYMLSKIPMGRFGKVEEMAAMICWLASEDCSFTTGGVFDLSGGRATY